jgi:cytochrome c
MPRLIHTLAAVLLLSVAPAMAQEAAGNAEAGQRVFNQCRACHTINRDGRNMVGPNLFGVVGRRAGSVDGFRYSRPMHEKHEQNFVWTEDNLRAYIRNPKEVVPNGAMSFPGLRNEQQLNDLLAYLRAQK